MITPLQHDLIWTPITTDLYIKYMVQNYGDEIHTDVIALVLLGGSFAECAYVGSRVPKRTDLGPILFLCYFHNLPTSVSDYQLKGGHTRISVKYTSISESLVNSSE